MTTTIFRNNKDGPCIASDSRVTWICNDTGLPIKWVDSSKFVKTLTIDGVMYGFAGSNVMFKLFLINYTTIDESEFLLDTIVDLAKKNRFQFFIIRYEHDLKLFGYSPLNNESPEIFRISTDPVIKRRLYAIGSGKHSKQYKKNKQNKSAQVPIRKIIKANNLGLKKSGMLNLDKKFALGTITIDESKQAYIACNRKGGDLFTGGDVIMTKSVTKKQIDKQIEIMEHMDQQAKFAGAVCASPVDARLEVKQLALMGHYPVSPNTIDYSNKRTALFNKMQKTLLASI